VLTGERLGEEADHRVGERLGALDRRQMTAALDHLEPRAANPRELRE
jgi:hypothetical protein